MRLEPFTVTGRHVVLEPLAADHVEALVDAANLDRASYRYTQVPAHHDEMRTYVESLLATAQGDTAVPFVQRLAVNTEAKLLLLAHAFEMWQVHCVGLCADARNERSRTAIARLGAQFEGVLRNHRRAAG